MARRARHVRGQAVTEVALGLLVLVPMILGGLYLAEAAMFRVKATEAATEPMWDATAYQNNAYTGAFNRTPSAAAAANAAANGRATGRTMLFTRAGAAQVRCTAGTGLGLSIASTASVYADNGGLSCTSSMVVDPKGITRFFVDTGPGGLFQVPMERMLRAFTFCQTRSCAPFKMAIGDWGLTNRNGEDAECDLTMTGCANAGFYGFARRVYEANRNADGTRNDAYLKYVDGVVKERPARLDRLTDFQMSFKGEEHQFIQVVPVSEGEPEWHTTPTFGPWDPSYQLRTNAFLGGT